MIKQTLIKPIPFATSALSDPRSIAYLGVARIRILGIYASGSAMAAGDALYVQLDNKAGTLWSAVTPAVVAAATFSNHSMFIGAAASLAELADNSEAAYTAALPDVVFEDIGDVFLTLTPLGGWGITGGQIVAEVWYDRG